MIAKHGGRYPTRGGSHRILEKGYRQSDRVVAIEFPETAAFNAWYDSKEYRRPIALRQSAAIDKLITLKGA